MWGDKVTGRCVQSSNPPGCSNQNLYAESKSIGGSLFKGRPICHGSSRYFLGLQGNAGTVVGAADTRRNMGGHTLKNMAAPNKKSSRRIHGTLGRSNSPSESQPAADL